MAFYLTIDIGNSSTKAAIWNEDELCKPPIWGNLHPSDLHSLCQGIETPVEYVALCSVADDKNGLLQSAAQMANACIEVGAFTPIPFSLGDYKASTLGPDRIAALAGAISLCPNKELLVIDCGTAITYDHMSAEGVFLGGNIAPGLGMRNKALNAFTARLPRVETDPNAPLWGLNTVEAIQAGTLRGVVGEIEYYHRQVPNATTILTGGRTRDLLPLLDFKVVMDPDLVLRGLRKIIQYNAQLIAKTND